MRRGAKVPWRCSTTCEKAVKDVVSGEGLQRKWWWSQILHLAQQRLEGKKKEKHRADWYEFAKSLGVQRDCQDDLINENVWREHEFPGWCDRCGFTSTAAAACRALHSQPARTLMRSDGPQIGPARQPMNRIKSISTFFNSGLLSLRLPFGMVLEEWRRRMSGGKKSKKKKKKNKLKAVSSSFLPNAALLHKFLKGFWQRLQRKWL